jgi:hypothetical protein
MADQLTEKIIGAAIDVHREMAPPSGLLINFGELL